LKIIEPHFLEQMGSRYIENTPYERMVIDYIAGMTDDFFNNEYRENILPLNFGMKVKN